MTISERVKSANLTCIDRISQKIWIREENGFKAKVSVLQRFLFLSFRVHISSDRWIPEKTL